MCRTAASIANLGTFPRNWKFGTHDPRYDWYIGKQFYIASNLIRSGGNKHRAPVVAWNLMNHYASTIQNALKRNIEQKRNQKEANEWTELVSEIDQVVDSLHDREEDIEWEELNYEIDDMVDSLQYSEEDIEWAELNYEIDQAVDTLRDYGEEYYDWVDRRLEEMFATQELED